MIYFIARSDRSAIKIGMSIRLTERLKQLTYQHGECLEVLGVMNGGRKQEKSLHSRFAEINIADEWFRPRTDLLAFIEQESRRWDGQDEADPLPARKTKALVVLATPEFKTWMESFMEAIGEAQAADVWRDAMRHYATTVKGFRSPPPR